MPKKTPKKRNTHKRVKMIKEKGKTVQEVALAVEITNSYLFMILYAKEGYQVTDSATLGNGKKRKIEAIREKIVDFLGVDYFDFWGVECPTK